MILAGTLETILMPVYFEFFLHVMISGLTVLHEEDKSIDKTMKKFDKTVGYSPLNCVNPQKQHQLITINKQIIDRYYQSSEDDWLLVAGAGTGEEALWIYTEFDITTIGIDINIKPQTSILGVRRLLLQKQDLMALAFKENTFSLIYSYHALEHVEDHEVALSELSRVLKPGGVLFIGFPNKNRLLAYINTSQKVTLAEKIKWNINDFKARLKRRFENRYGAHAGFTEQEFIQDATKFFQIIYAVRNQYMSIKYAKYGLAINLILKLGLAEILFPSNYFICIKSS